MLTNTRNKYGCFCFIIILQNRYCHSLENENIMGGMVATRFNALVLKKVLLIFMKINLFMKYNVSKKPVDEIIALKNE